MRDYETILIFKTGASDATVSSIVKKLEKVITKKPGKLAKKDEWGIKTLAYPIKKEKQGRYILWTYAQEPKVVAEIDRTLRFEENVLRYYTVVADEELKKHLEEKAKKAKKAAKTEGKENVNRYDVFVDYKDPLGLARYISERGKITPRRISGVSAKSQRRISTAIKRARQVALLSYTDGIYTGHDRGGAGASSNQQSQSNG